ncbi:MAG TPA: rRNA maturation RNase YbeY [Candidatus Acidoferrum sp.]|nr:rRNA maturation RNase YbeY [Candidatus Acidoferrum sp.]
MIVNRQRAVRLPRRSLEGFLRRLKKELDVGQANVTICFVSDAEIARMNERYRKKTGPTDVLSFSSVGRYGKKTIRSAEPESYLGDLAIAPATARRYAKKNGRSLPCELRVLILHGVLHLLGYDHETDRGEMNRLEGKLRRRFGIR